MMNSPADVRSRRTTASDCPDTILSAPDPEQTSACDRVSVSRHTAMSRFRIPRVGSSDGTRMRFRANAMAREHGCMKKCSTMFD